MVYSKTVDIIIPVYNAVEDLKKCVASILKHTTYKQHRIIIINDSSPEGNVDDYLKSINHEKIVILQNEKNMGFVSTVNKGMAYSKNDVILLNSDTIVTENWLEKLIKVAYLHESYGTVTPLTNNGTICSVPKFCEDNEIPEGFTIDEFAKLIENISLNQFPEIPTAVGFCMYIKRTLIEEIGLFDDVVFGRGYGEENDFCCKTIEFGYKNILADNTFIYHSGSMSFKEDKAALIKRNSKLLNERYPYYDRMVHEFIINNPLKAIHENIDRQIIYFRNSFKNKRNILFVLHNFFDEVYNHSVGGTEFHVKDIVENLIDKNCFVMASNNKEIVVKKYISGKLIGKYRFPLNQELKITHFSNMEYEILMRKVLGYFEINLVHIHHLKNHTFDLPRIAKEHGISVIYSLHDYYLFCPKITLLDENFNYCIDDRGEMKCKSCIKTNYSFYTYFLSTWKRNVEYMFEYVDLFITPSESTKIMFEDEFKDYFNKNKNIEVIEHGINLNENKKNTPLVKDGRFKVGFLGGLSPVKGSNMIYKLIQKYPSKNIEWHFIGELGDQKLNLLSNNNVVKHGAYNRDNLREILQKLNIDLIMFLSPGPETFSYTLTEAWDSGIPVIALPLGALGERVRKVDGGWITSGTKLEDIMNTLKIVEELPKEEWDKKVSNISKYKFKDTKFMSEEYNRLYSKFANKVQFDSIIKFNNLDILESQNYYLPTNLSQNNEQFNNELNQLKSEIIAIKSTIGWKVLERIRNNNPSALKFGKKLIKKILHYKK